MACQEVYKQIVLEKTTPEFIILSTEIQDKDWAGDIPEAGYVTFDNTKNVMYVDYVRVFQKK